MRDAAGTGTRRSFSGSVLPGEITLAPAAIEVTRGTPVRRGLAARGGLPPHRFQLEGTPLPKGLSLSPTGILSGNTSAAPGRYPLKVRVTDHSGGDGEYFEVEAFELRVVAPPAPSVGNGP